ncbi:MAG: clostripain-related cysteine peptidase [Bacteroides sp.]|nr:clostripain-related cysteine peptidase [Bacteroides sp.]MCI1683917.1 clostripain-related cysteine peptidase [Bacteroides sp.]
MEIDQLADALPDHVAEYIWFDVCLMESVEALYELRNKSDY